MYVIQSPNYYGLIEDLESFNNVKSNSLLIVISDPISSSVLKSPADCGCDIYVCDTIIRKLHVYGGPNIGVIKKIYKTDVGINFKNYRCRWQNSLQYGSSNKRTAY